MKGKFIKLLNYIFRRKMTFAYCFIGRSVGNIKLAECLSLLGELVFSENNYFSAPSYPVYILLF